LYAYAAKPDLDGLAVHEIFDKIYREQAWNIHSDESVSGEGSTLTQTRTIAAALPDILRQLDIRSILDIPCGDFNWMRTVDLGAIRYIGADIVEDLVRRNGQRFASDLRTFLHLDLLCDDLPAADLVFCRDCLVHLSFEDIRKALANIRRNGAKFLATTHFTEETQNLDINTGGWRPLNLQLHPFLFPDPVLLVNEHCTEVDGAFADKCIAVWDVRSLPSVETGGHD
jgi:hypothetical protein